MAPGVNEFRIAQAKDQKYKCVGYLNTCSMTLIPAVFHIDHQNPTRWGGPDIGENKQVLCPNCHASKSSHETNLSVSGSFIAPPTFHTSLDRISIIPIKEESIVLPTSQTTLQQIQETAEEIANKGKYRFHDFRKHFSLRKKFY